MQSTGRSIGIVLILGVLVFAPQFAVAKTNTPPIANPGGPYEGTTNTTQPILFDGSASSDADKDPLTYAWDFGDGTTGVWKSILHAYQRPGVFTVSLTVSDGTAADTKTTTAVISLKAPVNPSPESGAPFTSFPLILSWENVPEAQSYRYELIEYKEWLQGKTQSEKDAWIKEWTDADIRDWMEDGVQNGFLTVISQQTKNFDSSVLKFLEPWYPASWYQGDDCTTWKKKDENNDEKLDECTDNDVRKFIKEKQQKIWHVKSCEDTRGTTCGPWSAVWDFTYLLSPPILKTPDGSLPVTLDWDDVAGANSYEILAGPCPSWMQETGDCYRITEKESRYEDDICFFTRNTYYVWQVASCLDENSQFCGPESSQNDFTTALLTDPLSAPTSLKPPLHEDGSPLTVSWQDSLSWNGPACGSFYQIRFTRDDGVQTEFSTPTEQSESVELSGNEKDEKGNLIEIPELKAFWGNASNLNRIFDWTTTPCWKTPISGVPDCTNTRVSAVAKLQTAGASPTLLQPADGSSTKIPILLSWQGDGASYRYQIAKDEEFTQIATKGAALGTSIEIAYTPSDIIPGTPYWWRVKTCVDEKGDVCGPWSGAFTFSTFPLLIPDTPNPPDGGSITLDQQVSWKKADAANAYAYHLEYACRDEKENKEECVAYGANVCPDIDAIKIIKDNKIITHNSFELPYCMGQYEWKALSCLDNKCEGPPETKTTWSNGGVAWKLSALQPLSAGAGLVPCGRLANNDATPYDETEKCQLKHAGFLLQNLLDFILWKLSLATLLVLAVMTGATSYFSLGGPNALKRIKATFRSFLAGFLMLMFAWMFVNIVLMLFGFNFEFFGKWWEISF